MVIRYAPPDQWIKYSREEVSDALVAAKAAIQHLATIPYQRSWVDKLQAIELKREVAGTSRIEGADFTERELDDAIDPGKDLVTRSQRQARAALAAYAWISQRGSSEPVSKETILMIHRKMIAGADDDHCPPGVTRERDQNVIFGTPKHRGVNGGKECDKQFGLFVAAIEREFPEHDPLVQAIAAHYHLAAMHPFLDGNGRTARATEALLLRRASLRDTCFIAMSNYYYDEKNEYLRGLSATRASNHDLTGFLKFCLRGVKTQAERLLTEINRELSKALFRNMMHDLFGRLRTPKRRVIAQRQLAILNLLLDRERMKTSDFILEMMKHYEPLKNPRRALVRDAGQLFDMGAIDLGDVGDESHVWVLLDWPTRITETEFFARAKKLPSAKSTRFLLSL